MSLCVSLLFYDGNKQDAAKTTERIKRIIKLLKKLKIISSKLSMLWENRDGCPENYRCSTALYLL